MLPSSSNFDVYVTAAGSESVRQATLIRLLDIYPLDTRRADALVSGERVQLRNELNDEEAQRVASSLRALGLRVDIEAHGSALDMVDLGSFTKDEPKAAAIGYSNPLFDLNAGLVGLDGAEDEPPPPARPMAGGTQLGGLMGMSLRDEDEPLAEDPGAPRKPKAARKPAAPPPAPIAAAPPPPRAAAPRPAAPAPRPAAPAPAEGRFSPVGVSDSSLEIEIDRPPPDPMLSQPPPRQDVAEVPRCPTHGIAKQGGRCPRCDSEESEVRGRLFAGKLRGTPVVRAGIGIGAGLLIGWVLTAPMARKSERAVAFIREEAAREHQRPLEEAQAHAAQLTEQADDAAQSAFFRTLGVWGLIVGVTTAAWFRLT